jgi:hypothetical protein
VIQQTHTVSDDNGLLFLFIETVRDVEYTYICMCVSSYSRMEEERRIKSGQGVRYERMDGCKIYTVNVESLVR